MLSTFDFTDCPQLDVAAILAEVPYLGDLPRQFYRTYLEARREALWLKTI